MNRLPAFLCSGKSRLAAALLILLLAALSLFARTAVDFDPNLDFSKYKTFAFIGPVENLVMMEINSDLINLRLHHSITRELTKKGLREVQANQNPDLVVRYWANTSKEVNLAVLGNWGPYVPYINSYWAWEYNDVSATSAKESCLVLDLIDPRTKTLTWRLYLVRKFSDADKEWKKADDEITKAFDSFPPSDKEKEAKRKERSEHPPKPDQP